MNAIRLWRLQCDAELPRETHVVGIGILVKGVAADAVNVGAECEKEVVASESDPITGFPGCEGSVAEPTVARTSVMHDL